MARIIAASALAQAIMVGALALSVHPDVYPAIGTYGISVGADTSYVSFELVYGRPLVSQERAK